VRYSTVLYALCSVLLNCSSSAIIYCLRHQILSTITISITTTPVSTFHQFAFHQDARQYLSEFILLEHFISSPCRVPRATGDPNSVTNMDSKSKLTTTHSPLLIPPIYHIICFPFKYVLSVYKLLTPPMIRDLQKVLNDVLLRYVLLLTYQRILTHRSWGDFSRAP